MQPCSRQTAAAAMACGSQRQRSSQRSGYAMQEGGIGALQAVASQNIFSDIVSSLRGAGGHSCLQYLKYTVKDFAWAERWRGEGEAAAGGSSGGLEASGVKVEDRAWASRRAWSKRLGEMGR